MIRLLLVDDHTSLRDALAFLLNQEPELEVTDVAATLAEARARLAGVDVVLLDLELPDGNGIALLADLRAGNPAAHALVLTGHTSTVEHAQAIEAGAAGIVHKAASVEEIVAAIRQVATTGSTIPQPELVALLRLAARHRARDRQIQQIVDQLTLREREILGLLVEGLSEKEIAQRLYISANTARNHTVSIMAKLGAHSRLQAALLGVRYGIVSLPDFDDDLL